MFLDALLTELMLAAFQSREFPEGFQARWAHLELGLDCLSLEHVNVKVEVVLFDAIHEKLMICREVDARFIGIKELENCWNLMIGAKMQIKENTSKC